MAAFGINSIIHILCNDTFCILENRSFWKNNIVNICIKYGILVVRPLYFPIIIFYPTNHFCWTRSLTIPLKEYVRIYLPVESFQLKMGLSFPFLSANDLRLSLLIMRTRSFLLSFVGGTYERLVYSWFDTLEGEGV